MVKYNQTQLDSNAQRIKRWSKRFKKKKKKQQQQQKKKTKQKKSMIQNDINITESRVQWDFYKKH